MTITQWPASATTPSVYPTYNFHTHRIWDYSPAANTGCQWRHIQPSSTSQYSWSASDAVMDAAYAKGKDIYWQLYGTPTWAAKTTPQDFSAVHDNYGYLGGASPPASQAYINDFVSTLVARYVSRGTPIKYLSCWNEARFSVTGAENTAQLEALQLSWLGSGADMATLLRTVSLAAKAADPNIIVLGASKNTISNVSPDLAAADGSGGFGRDHIDGAVYHPYLLTIPPFLGNTAGTPAMMSAAHVAQMVVGGLASSFPQYAPEMAVASVLSDTDLGRHPAVQMSKWIQRVCAWLLVNKWQMVGFYTHESLLLGAPATNPTVSAALDQACSALTSKTITKIDIDSDGFFYVYAGATLLLKA